MLGRRGEGRKGDHDEGDLLLSFSAEIPKRSGVLTWPFRFPFIYKPHKYSDTRFSDRDSKFHQVAAQDTEVFL
jgi:hypothetical protein